MIFLNDERVLTVQIKWKQSISINTNRKTLINEWEYLIFKSMKYPYFLLRRGIEENDHEFYVYLCCGSTWDDLYVVKTIEESYYGNKKTDWLLNEASKIVTDFINENLLIGK